MANDATVRGYPDLQFLLFLAGNAPRSRRVRTYLRKLLEQLDYEGNISIEEVDVLQEPDRWAAKGLFATPATVVVSPDGRQTIVYGDLSRELDQHRLLALLNRQAER